MSGGTLSSEEMMKAAADLNAHVALLDQESESALIIKEIFFHLNQINEEAEKVIMLSDLIKDNNENRMRLLGDECKNLLVKFYQALLNKVHLETIDGLIKIENNGEMPSEPKLSEERLRIENKLFDRIVNASGVVNASSVNDNLEKLNLEKKIVILEAMLHRQQSILHNLADSPEHKVKKETIHFVMQRINQLQSDCRKIYDAQQKILKHNHKQFQSIPDESNRRAVVANEKENAVSLHISTLHSTLGENHQRTQRFQEIQVSIANEANPVLRALLLGDILENEIEGKNLLKPDLLVMKQYHSALLQVAAIRLIDELIGEDKVSKLKEPWLSIERGQVQNRLISHGDNHEHDPCKDMVFPSAMSMQEQEKMRLVLIQATKLHLLTSNNHSDVKININDLVEYLDLWEKKYKERVMKDAQSANSSLSLLKEDKQPQLGDDTKAKKRWRIWNIFLKNKR